MKTVSQQEVTAHLKRQNRWWGESPLIDPLIADFRPRDYLQAVFGLVTDLTVRRAVVLLGPRRVGKTILIHHAIAELLRAGHPAQNIAYVAVDHPLLHGETLDSLVKLFDTEHPASGDGPRFLFFDEIQYLKDWERHLKALVDARPDLRLLVSGSAAAALQRKSRESGAGRFTDFLLPPLTFAEYIALTRNEGAIEALDGLHYLVKDIARLNALFVEYVNFGGYPELALSETIRANPDRFIKSDIVDKVLLRDLPTLYGIQDIQELNALFTQLAYNSGEELSLEALAQRSGVAKQTISRYIEYLEAAFLVRRVFRVDRAGKRLQRERSFKVYLTNPAMRTGLFGDLGADHPDFGHLVETAMFAQRFHDNARLHYARWKEAEVDMIELDRAFNPKSVTEIKWSDRVVAKPGEIEGVTRFCNANKLTQAWVTTRTLIGTQEVASVHIDFIPAAALAYHLGIIAVQGRMAGFKTTIGTVA